MAELRERELRAVIEAAARLGAAVDLPDLRRTAVAVCGSLVGADLTSYNEIGTDRPPLVVTDHGDGPTREEAELMGKLIHENPIVAHFATTGDGRARRFSDFLGERDLRRLPLHREVYCGIGVNFQLAISTASPAGPVIGVALSRIRGDFADAEVAALDLLRPPLISAHSRLTEIDWLRRMLAALEAEDGGTAVVLASPDGQILRANAGGRALLGDGSAMLPTALVGTGARRLAFDHRGATLHARIVPDEGSETIVVTLTRSPPETARLTALALGLSQREAEVLVELMEAGGSVTVARRLGISPRTVEKHLQNAYRKLGVGGRREAMAALLTLGGAPAREL